MESDDGGRGKGMQKCARRNDMDANIWVSGTRSVSHDQGTEAEYPTLEHSRRTSSIRQPAFSHAFPSISYFRQISFLVIIK